MKLPQRCFFLLLCLLLAGCGQTAGPTSSPASEPSQEQTATPAADTETADPWGLSLSALDVTPTSMTLVFTQSGGSPTGQLQTGSPFWLETKTDDGWEAVPTLPAEGEIVWTAIAYGITSGDITTLETSWSYLYGSLSPGVYRIGKEITDYRGPGDYDTRDYYAVFAIVDE